MQNAGRQMGGNVSFSQSLSASQPATPLDLSEFPSLSNNSQLPNANQGSMWSTPGNRNISGPVQRNQSTPLSSQQSGHDDLYNSSSRMASYRYGNQGNMPASLQGQSSTGDDFPPLNRGGNGLLSALTSGPRGSEVRSPPGIGAPGSSRPQEMSAPGLDQDASNSPPVGDGPPRALENEGSAGKKEDREGHAPDAVDPLSGMPTADRWGLKGLRTQMNNYPDYHAMIVGIDPNAFGLDMGSQDLISTQTYSLFDETPPRPLTSYSKVRLPECYNVTNVQDLYGKIPSFGDETLLWIFYSRPLDKAQHKAAQVLHSRNWRWHRKHHVWLTKDEHMQPTMVTQSYERGFYIVWDAQNWRKERRELTLYYNDLDGSLESDSTGQ